MGKEKQRENTIAAKIKGKNEIQKKVGENFNGHNNVIAGWTTLKIRKPFHKTPTFQGSNLQ